MGLELSILFPTRIYIPCDSHVNRCPGAEPVPSPADLGHPEVLRPQYTAFTACTALRASCAPLSLLPRIIPGGTQDSRCVHLAERKAEAQDEVSPEGCSASRRQSRTQPDFCVLEREPECRVTACRVTLLCGHTASCPFPHPQNSTLLIPRARPASQKMRDRIL